MVISIFKKKLGYTEHIVKINRVHDDEFSPIIDEPVKLWNHPETKRINVYAKGSFAGRGLIGILDNKEITKHLRKKGYYEAIIQNFSEEHLLIRLKLINEYWNEEEATKRTHESWRDQIQKEYNPKSSWQLRFFMDDSFKKNKKIKIQTEEQERVLKNIENVNDFVWIEDMNGNKLSEKNYSTTSSTIKTLRATYSGNNFQIKKIGKQGDYYEFRIEVEN